MYGLAVNLSVPTRMDLKNINKMNWSFLNCSAFFHSSSFSVSFSRDKKSERMKESFTQNPSHKTNSDQPSRIRAEASFKVPYDPFQKQLLLCCMSQCGLHLPLAVLALRYFSWLLDHVTYLKLRKKCVLLAKLSKFTKWCWWKKVILSKNSSYFVTLLLFA